MRNPRRPILAARSALFRHVDDGLATMNTHAADLQANQQRKPAHVYSVDEAQRAQSQPAYTEPSPAEATDQVPLWMFVATSAVVFALMVWVVPAMIGGR